MNNEKIENEYSDMMVDLMQLEVKKEATEHKILITEALLKTNLLSLKGFTDAIEDAVRHCKKLIKDFELDSKKINEEIEKRNKRIKELSVKTNIPAKKVSYHHAFSFACTECGMAGKNMATIDNPSRPNPGDLLVCDNCGNIMTVLEFTNKRVVVRNATKEEKNSVEGKKLIKNLKDIFKKNI